MATKNEITGDALISKASNQNYADNYDRIFGKRDMRKTVDVKGEIVIQPKQWVDLSPEEVTAQIRDGAADGGWQGFAQRIVTAFKEKNNGHS